MPIPYKGLGCAQLHLRNLLMSNNGACYPLEDPVRPNTIASQCQYDPGPMQARTGLTLLLYVIQGRAVPPLLFPDIV